MPPLPSDGGFHPENAAATGSSTTGTAQSSLFDSGTLDTSKPIVIDYGAHPSRALARHLPAEDRSRDPFPVPAFDPNNPSATAFQSLLSRPVTFFTQDKAAFLDLQRQLFIGGYYGATSESSIPWGSFTSATQQAWLHLLEATQMAQTSGAHLTPDDVLAQAVAARTANQGKAPASPLLIQHEDPKAIAGALQQAAQATLGRDLSDAEVEHFISEYKAAEDAYGRQRQSATDATAGQRVDLTAPNLTGEATAFVKDQHGAEAGAQNAADYVGALRQMIGGL